MTRTMTGPEAFETFITDFSQNFSATNPAQAPIVLAQLQVVKGMPFKSWFVELKVVVVGVMNMGTFNPGFRTIQGNIKSCLAGLFPTLLLPFSFISQLQSLSTTAVFLWNYCTVGQRSDFSDFNLLFFCPTEQNAPNYFRVTLLFCMNSARNVQSNVGVSGEIACAAIDFGPVPSPIQRSPPHHRITAAYVTLFSRCDLFLPS